MVRLPNIPGYGKLVLINHTPNANQANGDKQYIYTLYAHLDSISLRNGYYVLKDVTIGTVGHTGHSTHKPGNRPDHFHFEVFDVKWEVTVGDIIRKGGAARKFRVDPTGLINRSITVNGTLEDMVESAIVDRMVFVPDVDYSRTDFIRMRVWLDGKNLGDLKDVKIVIKNINYDFKKELRMLH